ncbi:MAG: hypothetical protein Q8O64_13165 [Sideroxyarcus sp.]|nr:hypothetical protein [Sideroxyarcus sp.]
MSILAHITTGVIAATVAITSILGWQHFHPAVPIAKVDIIGIFTSQQKSLAAQLKPGMDKKAQAALIEQASRFGKQLDAALAQVVGECKCALINSAAIVRDAPEGATRDYSNRVVEILGHGKR